MPSRLEATDGGPLEKLGKTSYPIPAAWPCTHSHLNLSSMNGFHWFKGTKEEILAHLTHFDGTVAAHAYTCSSTTKALQEDHGQQWRVWHCQSWGVINSTHKETCTVMDLQVCINVTQSRSGRCKESPVSPWKCLTWFLPLSCKSTGCLYFRQSSGLKTDLKEEKRKLLNHLTQGGVMTVKYAELIAGKPQDTGAWIKFTEPDREPSKLNWHRLLGWTHSCCTESATCWFCLMYYPKRQISIRIILPSFTFPTGRKSFKARREVSIEAGRWKLNLYSLFLSQLKDMYDETPKLL